MIVQTAKGRDARKDRVGLASKREHHLTLSSSDTRTLIDGAYLSSSIAWQGVVPQTLVRAFDGLLIMAVVTVSGHGGCQGSHCGQELEHDESPVGDLERYESEVWRREKKGKERTQLKV